VSSRLRQCSTLQRVHRRFTFSDDFKVSLAVDLNASLLNAGTCRRHLGRVSRLADSDQIRTLGNVLLGELDGDFVLTFHRRHVDTRVGQ